MNEKIIRICEQKFIYLNYSDRTKENYISHINRFLDSIGSKQVIHLNSNDFQNYLDNYNFTSISQQNQIINSIRFLYKYGLNKKYIVYNVLHKISTGIESENLPNYSKLIKR